MSYEACEGTVTSSLLSSTVYSSIHSSNYLSICPSVHSSFNPSIHPFMLRCASQSITQYFHLSLCSLSPPPPPPLLSFPLCLLPHRSTPCSPLHGRTSLHPPFPSVPQSNVLTYLIRHLNLCLNFSIGFPIFQS